MRGRGGAPTTRDSLLAFVKRAAGRLGILLLVAAGAHAAGAQSAIAIASPPFPLTNVGQTAMQNVTITVTGANGAVFNSFTLAPGFPDFALETVAGCVVDGVTVNPQGTVCTIPVRFNPVLPGNAGAPVPIARSAPLLIDDIEGGTPQTYAVAVTGSATEVLPVYSPGIISDLAGNDQSPQSGYAGDGGGAGGAVFNNPAGIAVDAAGNIYIADSGNCIIRRIDKTTNSVNTVAGIAPSPTPNCGLGTDGVPATGSMLNNPTGIALDAAGNLYISDSGNAVIRMVSAATGLITTIAGTPGSPGFSGDNGPANSAQLSAPTGISVDGYGNLYIADTGNIVLREVAAGTGTINTIAGIQGQQASYAAYGNPPLAEALGMPQWVAADSAGNVYVSDGALYVIWQVNVAAQTISAYGLPTYPGIVTGVAVDASDNVYYTQSSLCTAYKFGQIEAAIAGNSVCGVSGDGGLSTSASLNNPTGITVDGAGNLYILESDGVRYVNSTGGSPFPYAFDFGSVYVGTTSNPQFLTITNGDIQPSNGNSSDALTVYQNPVSSPFSIAFPAQVNPCTNGNGYAYPFTGGQGCALGYKFAPTVDASWAVPASINIADNDGNFFIPETIPLSGVGIGSLPTATLTPLTATFNTVARETIGSQVFTLTNTSAATPLTITLFSLTGSSFGFSINSATCTSTLAPGASCTIPVNFSQSNPGSYSQTLTVLDDTASGSQSVTMTANVTQPLAALSVSNISFGNTVELNTTSAAETVTLSSTGTAPLHFSGVSFTGNEPEMFSADSSQCPAVMQTGTSCKILIYFSPQSVGYFTANLLVTDDSGGAPSPGSYASQQVTLSGNAPDVTQALSFTLGNNAFPSLPVGQSETQTVTLTLNTANTVLKSIAIPVEFTDYSIGSTTGCTLDGVTQNPAGTVCQIAITFHPAYVGNARHATLIVTAVNNQVAVPYGFGLTGTSTGSIAVLTPGIISPWLATYGSCCGRAPLTGMNGRGADAAIAYPDGIAVDSIGNTYVSDQAYAVVYKITPDGTVNLYAGTPWAYGTSLQGMSGDGGGALGAYLSYPGALAIDSAGNLFIADTDPIGNSAIRRVDAASGTITTVVGSTNGASSGCAAQTDAYGDGCPGTQAILFHNNSGPGSIGGLAVDSYDNLYFTTLIPVESNGTDYTYTNSIRIWNPHTGIVTLFAGVAGISPGSGADGGPAIGAKIAPTALAIDSSNNVYAVDGYQTIRRIDTSGVITTVAGTAGTPSAGSCNQGAMQATGDGGLYSAASFLFLTGISFDAANNMYLVDEGACNVRRVDAGTGVIHTVAGESSGYNGELGNLGAQDPSDLYGSALTASLLKPIDVRLDANANLYILGADDVRKIDVSKSVMDFTPDGNVQVGANSPPQTVTVVNAGNARPLTFSQPFTNATAFGISTADFTRDTASVDCIAAGTMLQPGFACSISNDFTPTASGSPIADTQIINDSGANPAQIVNLYGNSDGTTAPVTLLPHLLNFLGAVNVSSVSQPVTLTNNGTTSVPIASISITGANANQFAIASNPCGASLAGGASCVIQVSFTPTALGQYAAQLLVADMESGGPAAHVSSLFGTAGTPVASFGVPSPTFNGIDFGDQQVNTTSAPMTLTLNSTGTAPLTISSIGINGTDAAQFAISSTSCGTTLAPQASCTVSVTFTPLSVSQGNPPAQFKATAFVSDDASPSSQYSALLGVGTAPASVPLVIQESIHFTDAVTVIVPVPLAINEGIHFSDAPAFIESKPLAINESIYFMDAPAMTLPTPLAISETLHLSDSAIESESQPLAISETLHFDESAAALAITALTINEVLHVADAPAVQAPTAVFIVEAIHVSDTSTSIQIPVSVLVNEVVHTQDAPATTPAIAVTVNESIHTADAPATLVPLMVQVNEVVHTLDAPSVPFTVVVNETIHTLDAPGMQLSASVLVDETVYVEDVPAGQPSAVIVVDELIHTVDTPMAAGPAMPIIAFAPLSLIPFGTTLSGELNATASFNSSVVPGSFIYTASPATGSAQLVGPTTVLPAGNYQLTATFAPADPAEFQSAMATAPLTVAKATPAVTLVSLANPSYTGDPLTLNATVASSAGTPGGTVTFMDGGSPVSLGTANLAGGTATLNVSDLSAGQHSLTAVYNGDSNFNGAMSAPLSQSVTGFVLNVSGSATVIALPGQQTTFSFAVTPVGVAIFPEPIAFSLTGLPAGATYNFSQSTIAAGASATIVTLTIHLAPAAAFTGAGPLKKALPVSLALLLIPFFCRSRRAFVRYRSVVFLVASLIGLGGMLLTLNGCVETGITNPSPKTYTLTVTASSGAATQSTTLMLTEE